jgi:hypothetical protein
MRRVGILLAVTASVVVVLVSGAAASAPTTVSGASPYAGCSNANQPGTVYVNAEVEPQVAVNPANTKNIIGVWQQDRWSNGGAHGLVAGFSPDGGTTWGETTLPFSVCAPNAIDDPFTGTPYNRASDPWVSIGPDGTAYAVGLLATNSTLGRVGGTNDTGVATVTSSDGGKMWGNPRLERADQGTTPFFEASHFFNDKESITADPVHAGTAYVVWDRLQAPSFTPDAVLRAHAFRGPTWFSKTTDGGETWTGARPIFDPGQNSQTIGNVVVVDPRNGTLYDFFEQFSTTGSPKFTPRGPSVSFIKSTDSGNTWSDASTVSAQDTVGDTDPNTGQALRTGAGLPSVAIDGATGQLYVVWEDARFTGGTVNQVVISTSTDGGQTWHGPTAVSGSQSNGTPAFTPTVAVNPSGTVRVTYYDMRNLPAGDTTTLPTDLWLTTSTDHGATFGNETHVAGSFDMLVAPKAGGLFLGDYEGLGVSGSAFMPFFVQTNDSNTSNRTDVFTSSF